MAAPLSRLPVFLCLYDRRVRVHSRVSQMVDLLRWLVCDNRCQAWWNHIALNSVALHRVNFTTADLPVEWLQLKSMM